MKVGDKLWYVGNVGGAQQEVTVTKIGRIYVYLSNGDRMTLGSPLADRGRCHKSRVSFERDFLPNRLWLHFCWSVSGWNRPAHLDEAAIRKIAELVGVTLP